MTIRLLVADNQNFLVQMITSYISAHVRDIEVVGTANSYEDLLKIGSEVKPDIALLDRYLGKVDLMGRFSELKMLTPGAHLIIFTAFPHPNDAQKAIQLGYRGYVDKGNKLEVIINCIRKVFMGGTCINLTNPSKALPELTPDEEKVLRLTVSGLMVKEIASHCKHTESWVYSTRKILIDKFGASDLNNLIDKALDVGF
jgi:DNA-binding NarL/FixJ family response regulator